MQLIGSDEQEKLHYRLVNSLFGLVLGAENIDLIVLARGIFLTTLFWEIYTQAIAVRNTALYSMVSWEYRLELQTAPYGGEASGFG